MVNGGRRWIAIVLAGVAATGTGVTIAIPSHNASGEEPPHVCAAVGCASRLGVDVYAKLNREAPWPREVGSLRVCIDRRCGTVPRPRRDEHPRFDVRPRSDQRRSGAVVPVRVDVRARNGAVIARRASRMRVKELLPNGRRCPPRCFTSVVRFVLRSREFQRNVAATTETRRVSRVARAYGHRRFGRPERAFAGDDRCDTLRSGSGWQYECVVAVSHFDSFVELVFTRTASGLRLATARHNGTTPVALRCATAHLPADIACGPPPGED